MRKLSAWLVAGLVAAGLLACQKEDPATKEWQKKIDDRLAAMDKKLDQMAQGRVGAMNPAARGPQPGAPDPTAIYAVPIEGDPTQGAANAPITIVQIEEFA